MQILLRLVAMTNDQELSCDEVFVLVGQFSEKVLRGEDGSKLTPLVQNHLNMYPDCREGYEALLKMMEDSAEQQEWRF